MGFGSSTQLAKLPPRPNIQYLCPATLATYDRIYQQKAKLPFTTGPLFRGLGQFFWDLNFFEENSPSIFSPNSPSRFAPESQFYNIELRSNLSDTLSRK